MPGASIKLKNARGQGLLSVMMAIPITVIGLVTLGHLTEVTQREYMTFKALNETSKIQDDLRAIIGVTETCASHLHPSSTVYNSAAATSAAGMELAFVLNDNVSVVRSNSLLKDYGVQVNSLKYKVHSAAGSHFAPDPRIAENKMYYGAVVLNTRSTSDPRKPSRDRSIGSMVMSVSPTGTIERCFLLDKAFGFCDQAGGTIDSVTGSCLMPDLCPGQIFLGYDPAGSPLCRSIADVIADSCPPGTVLISNGSGDSSCGLPYVPAATPTPVPTPIPTPTPASPSGPGPAPTPSPTPTPGPNPRQPSEPQYTYTDTQVANSSSLMPAPCKAFLTNPQGVNYSATNDVTITGQSSGATIPLARNVVITGNSAGFDVRSAYNVTITGNSGSILTRSWSAGQISGNSGGTKVFVLRTLGNYEGNSGNLCVSAQSIQTLSGGSGNHHIIAKAIGNITGNSGDMHIYGATVNTVSGSSSRICLHNGARIINYDSSNSGVVSTTCP